MLAPTCSTMISSDEPRCQGLNQSRIQFPLSIGTILARDSIVGIPIPCSISLSASLFYSFRSTSSRDQLLDHPVHIMMMSYRVGPEIPLRLHGVTNPSLDSCHPTDTFGDTRSVPLYPPSYVVTFGTPKAFLRYPGVAQSHGLRKRYSTLESSSKTNYTILCYA